MSVGMKSDMSISPESREVVYTRLLDAPRVRVFQVCTNPHLIPRWWGPRDLVTMVEKMDIKPGGAWRFVQRDVRGNEYVFHGEYREIVPPERLAYTFEYEGMPGHVILETIELADQNGRTRLSIRNTFESMDDLESMLQTGMEDGAIESFERLEALLKEIKA